MVIGRELDVARASGHVGQAMVEGAWWNMRSREPLKAGDRVRVRDVEGLELLFDPVAPGGKEARDE
jgi:membrane protein implicated in regulation of membrane protease activity